MNDALSAVPLAADGVRAEHGSRPSGLLLRRRVATRGSLAAWLERHFGLRREHAFELDMHGASFWRAVDGRRTLAEIEAVLREEHDLDQDAARAAVIAFTQTLMRRGLISLRVSVPEEARHGP